MKMPGCSARSGYSVSRTGSCSLVVLFKTIVRAIEGKRFAWDKLERTAAVSYRPSEDHDSVNVL